MSPLTFIANPRCVPMVVPRDLVSCPRGLSKRYIFMKKLLIIFGLFSLPVLGSAENSGDVTLLGKKEGIPFDEIRAASIANAVKTLLQACTVTTKIDSIPPVKYKGVRVVQRDGSVIEAHILPGSINSYMVELYTVKNGVAQLHGKYRRHDYAYPLIAMLEIKI